MGFVSLFYPWGVVLQALALVHFIRRRPDTIWLWIIVFLGPLGALVYIGMEVLPDLGLLRHSFDAFGRRKRIKHLEALVIENPSPGNDKELARRVDPDPMYRRGIAAIQLGDFPAAVRDLEEVTTRDGRYDSHRAIALLAHAYANAGEPDKADALFTQATEASTLTETYFHYASFLASQQRHAEAREWANRILARKASMPRYLQRRERPWIRKTAALLKRLPKA